MASAKRKSKKRSASNSAPPPERTALFIDRSAWSRVLGDALETADIPHVAHHQHFKHDCPDEEWLRGVSGRGWIVLTRDQNIRRKVNELRAFREAGLHVFVLASGNASAADHAALVVKLYPKFLTLVQKIPPPAMFSVSLKESITLVRA